MEKKSTCVLVDRVLINLAKDSGIKITKAVEYGLKELIKQKGVHHQDLLEYELDILIEKKELFVNSFNDYKLKSKIANQYDELIAKKKEEIEKVIKSEETNTIIAKDTLSNIVKG